MKRHLGLFTGLAVVVALGCGKKEAAPTAAATAAIVGIVAPSPVEPAQPKPAAPAALSATAPAAVPGASATQEAKPVTASDEKPESFSGGETVANAVATGLGCEAKSKDGWLQLLCRKKNGAGGHPKRAVLGAEGDTPELTPDEQNELKVVMPYHSGAETNGFIEWTDTKYNLKVKDGELSLEWAVTLEMRKACAELEKASKELINKALKSAAEDHLIAAEASKLPRFGVCQNAGRGGWALALRGVEASGADAARAIALSIDVVRVGEDGTLTKGDLGKIVTKPGGLELRPLQIYDYDDDASSELIIPHDLKAIPTGATPTPIAAVWTFKAGAVTAYANFAATLGGVQTTHLEYDMRPDLSRYEPFVAYLGADCGIPNCPTRLVGPARFARSMPKGEFSSTDPQAEAALNRACPKGAQLVVEGNPTRTAQMVACARLKGEDSAKLVTDLKAKSASLCKGAETCPLLDALVNFANQTPGQQ
jgi:hypothetical protein